MRLQILHVPDCPNTAVLRSRLEQVVAGRDDIAIDERTVRDEDEAAALGLTGSPTVLIDGVDPFGAGPGTERVVPALRRRVRRAVRRPVRRAAARGVCRRTAHVAAGEELTLAGWRGRGTCAHAARPELDGLLRHSPMTGGDTVTPAYARGRQLPRSVVAQRRVTRSPAGLSSGRLSTRPFRQNAACGMISTCAESRHLRCSRSLLRGVPAVAARTRRSRPPRRTPHPATRLRRRRRHPGRQRRQRPARTCAPARSPPHSPQSARRTPPPGPGPSPSSTSRPWTGATPRWTRPSQRHCSPTRAAGVRSSWAVNSISSRNSIGTTPAPA